MMRDFRVLVPGVADYTGQFYSQQQAALDAERRYPHAPPACTFLIPPIAPIDAVWSESNHRLEYRAVSTRSRSGCVPQAWPSQAGVATYCPAHTSTHPMQLHCPSFSAQTPPALGLPMALSGDGYSCTRRLDQ